MWRVSNSEGPHNMLTSYVSGTTSRWFEPLSMLFDSVYATPKNSPLEERRLHAICSELYIELATLSVSRIEPNPLYGLIALILTPGFAAATASVGWLMSDSRCMCNPRRATYPTLRNVFQNSSRSTVAFHAHASGFLKALLCVVTTKGTWLA